MATADFSEDHRNIPEDISASATLVPREEKRTKPSTTAKTQFRPIIGRNEKEYKINPKQRGKVTVFNHDTFEENWASDRPGTEVDKTRLTEIFERLKFKVDIQDNKKVSEIKKFLEQESRNENLAKCDCYIIVVLTHGKEGGWLYAYDDMYMGSSLWEKFASKCVYLHGKPKLFILQACRGKDSSIPVPPSLERVEEDYSKPKVEEEMYTLPAEADVLIAYSTYDGQKSFRDPVKGTWFIQKLCDHLNSDNLNIEDEDILSLMTNVCHDVAVDCIHDNRKQMPVLQSTLTRKLFLTRSNWNNLKLNLDISDDTLPIDCSIFYLGNAVKKFVEKEKETLHHTSVQDAQLILYLLSKWPSFDENIRALTFRKLGAFIHKHESCRDTVYKSLKSLPQKTPNISPSSAQQNRNSSK